MKKSIRNLGITLLILACIVGITYIMVKYPLWYFGAIALLIAPFAFEKPIELSPDDPSF